MNNNLNRDIFVEEKEIDLKDMLYYICKKWRSVGICSLAAMVIMILVKIPALVDLKGIGAILKHLGKYALIGFLVGFFLLCVIYAIIYVTSDKIKSENEFKTNCRLDILGVLPKNDGKKLNGVDRYVRRIFGINRRAKEFNTLVDRLAEEIKAVLSTKSISKSDVKTIFVTVVSTETDKTAVELSKLINSRLNGNIKMTVAGNILENAESVRTVMNADVILMVGKIGETKYGIVEESYKKILNWEKDIIGIVLMNGDAI